MTGEKFSDNPNTTMSLPTDERRRAAIFAKREEYKGLIHKNAERQETQSRNFALTVKVKLIDTLTNGPVDLDAFTDDFIESEVRLCNPDDESGFREEIFFAGLAVKAYCEGNTEHLTGGTGLRFE